ncbi:MAG: hypothetical protein ACYTFP_07830 [Planctomycetota bacterium]
MRLNVKAFALACGLIWGLGLFCMARGLTGRHGLGFGRRRHRRRHFRLAV